MTDSEQDDGTSDPIERVLGELEAGFEAAMRREAEQETAAAVRAEAGQTPLWRHLTRRVGTPIVAHAGPLRLDGLLVASYPDFVALRTPDGRQHLVRLDAPATLEVGAAAPLMPATGGTLAQRYGLALALRELARRREPVRVVLTDERVVTGTIEVVGADYAEIAEHALTEARRRAAVSAHRLVPLAAVAVVSLPAAPPAR
ncbi:MAG TPA: hypothetical protein VKG45_02415 [Actinomycetes bacterium]|nr:hypothetical protein [Actinomycetes bacterium]